MAETARVARAPLAQRIRAALPQGNPLPPTLWLRRHRTVVTVALLHAPLLSVFGLLRGWSPAFALGEGAAIMALGLLSLWSTPNTRFRSAVAAFACVSCSAVLVQFSGGYIEAHFHFFIMVALIALYQDWLPFLVAVTYVALDHGVLGQVAPVPGLQPRRRRGQPVGLGGRPRRDGAGAMRRPAGVLARHRARTGPQ